MKKVVITSGYFNPVHVGHINLIREAKSLGDFLVVIVNNDRQVRVKGSKYFMPESERMQIIKAMSYVDDVFLSIDGDLPISKSLEYIAEKYKDKELIFAKGGDRNANNIPESEKLVCQKFNIQIANGVGGSKVQSSSWLLSNVANNIH